MELRSQIRIAREAAGFTQVELAQRLGVSRQSIVWWEEGVHRPKTARIMQIENVLNVKLDVSERGNAMPLDRNKGSLSVDPDILRLAVAIGRLPKRHRDAIAELAFIGEAKMLGTMSHGQESIDKRGFPTAANIGINEVEETSGEFNFVEKRVKNATATAAAPDKDRAKPVRHRSN